MFALIATGGKQYRVESGKTVVVEKLDGAEGDSVSFPQVLLVGDGETVHVGTPVVEGARVTGRIVKHFRGEKLIAFKKWRRQGKRLKKGHRQSLCRVLIEEVGVK